MRRYVCTNTVGYFLCASSIPRIIRLFHLQRRGGQNSRKREIFLYDLIFLCFLVITDVIQAADDIQHVQSVDITSVSITELFWLYMYVYMYVTIPDQNVCTKYTLAMVIPFLKWNVIMPNALGTEMLSVFFWLPFFVRISMVRSAEQVQWFC